MQSAKPQTTLARRPSTCATRCAQPAHSQDGTGYSRWRHLPRLVRIGFGELDDHSPGCTRALITRIEAAIARERRRSRSGHWSYDINRHIALIQALQGENELLESALKRGGKVARNGPGR